MNPTDLPDASEQLPAVEPVIEAQPGATFIPSLTSSGLAPAVVETVATPVEVVSTPEVTVPYVATVVPETIVSAGNDIGAIISSAKARKIAYALYVFVSFVITNTVIAYSSLEAPIPAWLKIALAVVGNSAVAFGSLAIANTGSKASK